MLSKINRKPKKTELHLTGDDLEFLISTYTADRGQRTKVQTAAVMFDKMSFFMRFWKAHGPAVDWRLTVDTWPAFNAWLDAYISPTTGRTLAWNTRNDAVRRLRQCLTWCVNNSYIEEDMRRLLKHFPLVHGAPPIKTAPDLSVWRAIWEQVSCSPLAVRDSALFAILAGTGMRRAECASLQIDDLKLLPDESGFLTIRDSKTGRPRIVAFDNLVGREITRYLDLWRIKRGPIFFDTKREPFQPLEPISVYRAVGRAASRAGMKDRYAGTHDIRRAYATFWMRKMPGEGYSWLLARELGHHVSNSMTSYYAKLDPEDIRLCLQKHRCSLFAQMIDSLPR